MALTLDNIEQLFGDAGTRLYGGEAVSQREHGLQAAWLAEQAGADDALVVACLLHDLGHMLFEQADDALAAGSDDLHQYRILPFLRGLLPDAVVEPIGLHVEAKRYLCLSEPGYHAALSPASQLSLQLQGGPMQATEAARFEQNPYAKAAIALRRHDDAAKVPGLSTPDFAYFLPRLAALAGAQA
ncbi:phosphonate degradation HD-domain oxygenase [Chitinimonas sp.]|uniref:phosphonate degradation HD-domain oxygenase n=1 Tax=Chitinimonas sp. TaxID=1934313 RepID=UPI0035B11B4A